MLLSAHKDLKEEIKSLPEREKDKLLLRLIAKDKVLTEHLHFRLLENEQDLVDRSEKLKRLIDTNIESLLNERKCNPGQVLSVMRGLNGNINHHFKVTRDVETEMELRLHLLNTIPLNFREGVFSSQYRFIGKLNIYFVKTTRTLLNRYYKMHEDLQFDLKESVNLLLNKVYSSETAVEAGELELPKVI